MYVIAVGMLLAILQSYGRYLGLPFCGRDHDDTGHHNDFIHRLCGFVFDSLRVDFPRTACNGSSFKSRKVMARSGGFSQTGKDIF